LLKLTADQTRCSAIADKPRCTVRHSFRQKYTVYQKNIPDVFNYNSRKHCRIFIIFGRNISKKASSQKMLYFSTSPS